MSEATNETSVNGGEKQDVRARSSRRSLWLVGGVFWILVVVAAYFVGERRLREMRLAEEQDGNRSSGVVMLTNDGSSPPAKTVQVLTPTYEKDPNSTNWDPAGIADFEFTDTEGKKITKQDLLGKPWVVGFIFTRCAGPCRTISMQMSRLQDFLVGKDVKLVSITVDPKYDTPQVLKRYSEQFNAEPGQWTYLTGDQDKTYRLIRDSFKMPVKEMLGANRQPGWEVMHSENILLVDAQGRVVGKYHGIDDSALAKLRRDIDVEIAKSKQGVAGEKPAPAAKTVPSGVSEKTQTTKKTGNERGEPASKLRQAETKTTGVKQGN